MIKSDNHIVNKYDASERGGMMEFISRNVREMVVYRYALYNFINTNLSSRYRRSTFGFLWSLLNPLFTMIIMAVVFSSLYKLPFREFSMYLFSGLLPWNLVTSSLMGGSMSIINAESYLKKVYIPKVLFPLTTLGVEMLNFLFSLASLFVLAVFLGANLGWSLSLLPAALLLLALFLFGLILLISILTVFFRDLSHILQIGLLGLFYLTPILYPITMIPDGLLQIIKLNPFYHFINLFHLIVYEATFPSLYEWLTCLGLSFLSLVIGMIVFQKKEKDVIYRL
jgi:ABC-type polysaccharide/polyol phosphate export permease